jgi:hypothetical protein
MHSLDRQLCQLDSPVEQIGEATRQVYDHVDCSDCLRRAIAEADARGCVLRELLAKVEALS